MGIYQDPLASALGAWSANYCVSSVILRIFLSICFSAVIGWERAAKRHSAGLRTFTLVSLGGTAAMLTDIYLTRGQGPYLISVAVVVAISIICINSIVFSSRYQIKGLTTSVALWVCAILGASLGAGCYTLALILFSALLCTISIFPFLESSLKDQSNHFEIHLELVNSSYLKNFVTTIRKLGMVIDDIELNPAYANSGLSVYSIMFSISSEELKKYKSHQEIIQALSTLDYIYFIEEMHG